MAAERPSVQSVKADVIEIALPYLQGAVNTRVTASISAGGTAMTVADNTDFAQNDYVIIGQIGQETTEIKRITGAVAAGTALTVAAVTFPHPEGTKVTRIRYDQLEVYGSSSSSDSSPTIIGSAESIDVSNGRNEIKLGTLYTYYYSRYKNSNASTFSSYSDAAIATGLTSQTRGEIKREFLSMYNEKIGDLVTDDWLNRTINRWQRVLTKRKNTWTWTRTSGLLTTVQDQQGYTLPTDLQDKKSRDAFLSVKFSDGPELNYMDQQVFLKTTYDHIGTTLAANIGLADTSFTLTSSKDFSAPSSGTATINVQGDAMTYTTNTKSTNVLSGGAAVTATHTSGDEVWQTYTTGQPTYYTIDNGKLKVYPIPDSVYANKNIHLEYRKKFDDLADDTDETACIYPENCYAYLYWQLGVLRKLPLNEQVLRMQSFTTDLENMVAEEPDDRTVRIEPRNLYRRQY